MKLTQQIKDQADRIIKIDSVIDFPFGGMLKKTAIPMIAHHGFYSFVRGDEKILVVKTA